MTAPVKAYLETESGQRISFLFNPTTLEVKRTVNWNPQESPGGNAPSLTFDRGQSQTLDFDLVLDTTDTGADVTTAVPGTTADPDTGTSADSTGAAPMFSDEDVLGGWSC